MSSNLKILWQAHEGNKSGANICLLEYLDILKTAGYIQHVMLPGTGSMEHEIRKRNVQVTIIPSYSWAKPINQKETLNKKLRKFLRNKVAILVTGKLIKQFNPDFVATNSIVNPTAAFAAEKLKKKHTWFVHEFGEEDHGFTIAKGFTEGIKIMDRLSRKIVFNASVVEKKYTKYVNVDKRAIVTYPISIPEVAIKEWSSGTLKLIMLGQIAPSKNHLEALKAFNICIENKLDIKLCIVGSIVDKNYYQTLKEYIQSEKLEAFVNFSPATDTPHLILSQFDVLLMCSRLEAFGRVTVEALKCGLPVIAANTGGSINIIHDGTNGFFYNNGNYNDLAIKIQNIYNKRHLFNRKKIAEDARAAYSIVNTEKQLFKVFN